MIQRHLLFIQCPSYRVSQNVLQQQQDRDAGNCQVGQTCSATGGTEATRWPEEAGPVSVSPFLSGSTVLNLTQRPLSEPRASGHGCTLARARAHTPRVQPLGRRQGLCPHNPPGMQELQERRSALWELGSVVVLFLLRGRSDYFYCSWKSCDSG